MIRIIIFVALFFSFVAFGPNIQSTGNLNIFNAYFVYSVRFLGNHIFLSAICFLIISFFVFKTLRFEKRHPKTNKIAVIITQSLFILVTGIFTSFLLLITIAVIELNFLAYIIDMSPSLLGIQTDVKEITNTLKKGNFVPEIIASDNSHYKELQAIARATTGTNSFYGKYILTSIPGFFVLPTGKIGSTMLIDKTLIVSEVNQTHLQTISPIIGYLFIKNYFTERNIRHFPKFNILSPASYKQFRKNDYAKKIAKVNNNITVAQEYIASLSAEIQNSKDNIINNQSLISKTYENSDKDYNKCVSDGYYKNKIFYFYRTKDDCKSIKQIAENTVMKTYNNIDNLNVKLRRDQDLLSAYKYYENLFKTQIKFAQSLQNNIPHELGFFDPKDSIKIVVDINSPHKIADYFETVIHEYYHYASFVDNKNFASSFFDEGLTEYFARTTIKNDLNISTNLGYPVYIKIVQEMLKKIPEIELADIYFTKDEKALEKTIDRVYGDGFYKNNLILFETLTLASNKNQELKLANNIMAKLGGPILKASDLVSFESNL